MWKDNTLDTVSLFKQIRLVFIKFATLGTEFLLSLSLIHDLSEWKRPSYFSLSMIPLVETINVKSVKKQFTKLNIQEVE